MVSGVTEADRNKVLDVYRKELNTIHEDDDGNESGIEPLPADHCPDSDSDTVSEEEEPQPRAPYRASLNSTMDLHSGRKRRRRESTSDDDDNDEANNLPSPEHSVRKRTRREPAGGDDADDEDNHQPPYTPGPSSRGTTRNKPTPKPRQRSPTRMRFIKSMSVFRKTKTGWTEEEKRACSLLAETVTSSVQMTEVREMLIQMEFNFNQEAVKKIYQKIKTAWSLLKNC